MRRLPLRLVPLVAVACLALVPTRARAADWLAIQGTELGQPDTPVRVWGFAQMLGEGIVFADPVDGLASEALSPFNGERAAFNAVGSGASSNFTVRRARLGVRGSIPDTGQKVNWMLAAEFGSNANTRSFPAVLMDASVTFNYVPGVRARLGRFKLPTMDETLEANPVAAEFINFSLAAQQLLLESPVRDGRYTGGANGFRDVGLLLFDAFARDRFVASYALALTNGAPGLLDVDGPKDLTARLMFSWVFDGPRHAAHRKELSLFAWRQQGRRTMEAREVDRVRQGAGVHFEHRRVRARVEFVDARGALELGPNPPFAGQAIQQAADGRARGAYAMVHVPTGRFGWSARYEELWRGLETDAALRIFRVATLGATFEVTPRAHLMLNYELRRLSAPHASPDAQQIAASMGDRLSMQATVNF